jgi:hypothetical protein
LQHAIDHGVADGDEGIDRAPGEAVDALLEEDALFVDVGGELQPVGLADGEGGDEGEHKQGAGVVGIAVAGEGRGVGGGGWHGGDEIRMAKSE